MTLLVYVWLTVAAFYLGSRAQVTSWLWSRYPRWLAVPMDCAACSGFWYGALLGAVLPEAGHAFVESRAVNAVVAGLGSLVWTPLGAALHMVALERLGTAVAEGDDA